MTNLENVEWKFRDLLKNEGVTVYRLSQAVAPKVSRVTLYRWNTGAPVSVNLEAIGHTLKGLEKLTGKRYQVTDLLEYVPAPEAMDEEQALLPSNMEALLEAAGERGNIVMPSRPGKPRGSANPLPPGPIPSEEYISQEREDRF